MKDLYRDKVLCVLLTERLLNQALPRAMTLRIKVAQGNLLNDFDIAFLSDLFHDVKCFNLVLARNPKYQPLMLVLVGLCREIVETALKNQEAV